MLPSKSMDPEEWKRQLRDAYRSPDRLPPEYALTDEERRFFDAQAPSAEAGIPTAGEAPAARTGPRDRLPFLVTPYYLSLSRPDPEDPIRRQFLPRGEELQTSPWELADPLGEEKHSPSQRLVHRYRSRALLLVTGTCATYCRHCFRRTFTREERGAIPDDALDRAAAYLAGRPEVKELLLSGGDPLILEDGQLDRILARIREARPDLTLRIGTRIPVVLPQRITPELAALLGGYAPLWISTQFNHPRELTPESRAAASRLVDRGVPMLNQAVLLRGVNDDPATLAELFDGLVAMRIKPYYLFQGDLAAGTRHLRVPLDRGLEIQRQLRGLLSGLAMPVYAVDLPGGGGKVPLTEQSLIGKEGDSYRFRGPDGAEYRYPAE